MYNAVCSSTFLISAMYVRLIEMLLRIWYFCKFGDDSIVSNHLWQSPVLWLLNPCLNPAEIEFLYKSGLKVNQTVVPNHGLVLHIAETGNEELLFMCMISVLLWVASVLRELTEGHVNHLVNFCMKFESDMNRENRAETCYYCHRFHNERNHSVLGNCRNRVTFVFEVFCYFFDGRNRK
jgi:hypothetical protein